MNRIRLFLGILFVAATAVACSGASNVNDAGVSTTATADDVPTSDPMYQQFLENTKAGSEIGLSSYWLGYKFTAGDVQFRGPFGVGSDDLVREDSRINIIYLSRTEGRVVGLYLISYTGDGWSRAKESVTNPAPPPLGGNPQNVRRRSVTVGGRNAELLSIPGSGTHRAERLILDLGDVVVVADAPAGGETSPGGPDYSPFINDPDLLVQVMQDLRLYPQ